MAAGRGHFEGPLGGILTLDVAQIGQGRFVLGEARSRARHHLVAAKMVDDLHQAVGGEDVHVLAGPGGFRPQGLGR